MNVGDNVCPLVKPCWMYAVDPCIDLISSCIVRSDDVFIVVNLKETCPGRWLLFVTGRVTGYVWAHSMKKLC